MPAASSINEQGLLEEDSVAHFFMLPSSRVCLRDPWKSSPLPFAGETSTHCIGDRRSALKALYRGRSCKSPRLRCLKRTWDQTVVSWFDVAEVPDHTLLPVPLRRYPALSTRSCVVWFRLPRTGKLALTPSSGIPKKFLFGLKRTWDQSPGLVLLPFMTIHLFQLQFAGDEQYWHSSRLITLKLFRTDNNNARVRGVVPR